MGIDVGGTYTKCVAMDNLTHEIKDVSNVNVNEYLSQVGTNI